MYHGMYEQAIMGESRLQPSLSDTLLLCILPKLCRVADWKELKKNDSKIPMGSYTEFPPIPLSLCVPTHLQMRTLARQLFVFMCWFPMCSLYSLPWSQVQSVFCVRSFIRYNTKRQNAQMEWFTRLISFGNSKINFEVILVCMFCSFLRVMELAT